MSNSNTLRHEFLLELVEALEEVYKDAETLGEKQLMVRLMRVLKASCDFGEEDE